MELIRTYLLPRFDDDENVQRAARKRLLHSMGLIVFLISFCYSIVEFVGLPGEVQTPAMALMYFGLPACMLIILPLVVHNIGLRLISGILLASYFLFSLIMRRETGLFEPEAVYLMGLPMVGAMLFGFRTGIGLSVLVTAAYVTMYLARGHFSPAIPFPGSDSFALQSAIAYSVLGTGCAMSALLFIRAMDNVVSRLTNANAELNLFKTTLEQMVDQRTQKIQQQALELEAALKAEKEISAFQNQLVSVVSHEIRTPLSIIDGSARRIGGKAEQLSGDEIRQRTDTIRLSVRRLTQLVERTLESSRYAEGHIALKPSEFDPKAFLTGIIARERESATSHVFNLSVDGLPDQLTGDPTLLDHVISNILSNAVKYSGGNPDIRISTACENGYAMIRIRDHGIGIPANELQRISSRFFRASTALSIKGTGIGLFLTRRIVEDHGGIFSVDSVEGEWTEVSVGLRLSQPIAQPGAEPQAA